MATTEASPYQGLTETWETLELLKEESIEYVCDWVNDEQPYVIQTAKGPLVSVPYTRTARGSRA